MTIQCLYFLAMKQLTVAQVDQNFAAAAREAEQEPIEITRHGHGVLVLLSSEEFKRLIVIEPPRQRSCRAHTRINDALRIDGTPVCIPILGVLAVQIPQGLTM
ncbi:type II toxin-antitoxin system prevent-host-death family antitoxin [Pendulispora rubella]|uniref:type II toxin-antitoxin system prevent-host-death family antitoxin n=1 Tax=Pendulispora rubella TaxID=2741070 RepID=UPI00374E16FB